MSYVAYMPKCNDLRRCFAKGGDYTCSALTETYPAGKCPFCKPDRAVTDGYRYFKNGGRVKETP